MRRCTAMDSAGSARRDVGIAPYKVRPDSPKNGTHWGWICRVVEDADPYDGNAPAKNRRGRRPLQDVSEFEQRSANPNRTHVGADIIRPRGAGERPMPGFGATAALPVRCRGDLWSPADDASHKKRTVGRWLAAAKSAEMVMAAPRDRPTACLKYKRIRRQQIIIQNCPARATKGRPYRLLFVRSTPSSPLSTLNATLYKKKNQHTVGVLVPF